MVLEDLSCHSWSSPRREGNGAGCDWYRGKGRGSSPGRVLGEAQCGAVLQGDLWRGSSNSEAKTSSPIAICCPWASKSDCLCFGQSGRPQRGGDPHQSPLRIGPPNKNRALRNSPSQQDVPTQTQQRAERANLDGWDDSLGVVK